MIARLNNLPAALMVWCVAVLATTAPAAALQVEYGDCATVLAGPRCVLNEARTMRLWVRAEPGATLTVDDGRRAVTVLQQFDVDGGTHLEVQVPARSRRVRLLAGNKPDQQEWSIDLSTDVEAAELVEVKRLFNGGEFDAAEALILTLVANPQFEQRGSAHRLAGIFYHNRGAPDKAREFYQQAVQLNLAAGRWLEAVRAASALSFLSQHTFRDFAAARDVYAPFADLVDAPAEARFFESYDQGLLGLNTGDRRLALTQLERAARQAIRMGKTGRWLQRRLDAEELLASQLQRLGRRADARAYFDAWQTRDLQPLDACERADFLSNMGWNDLLSLEAGDVATDPTPLFEQALDAMREHCKPWNVASTEINLALAHLHARRFDASAAALARARETTQTPDLRLRFWELDIDARLAAARGDTDVALALLNGMEILAAATLSPDAAWRAAARRGVVLEQLGQIDNALNAYADADQRFANDLRHVPFYAGRGQFAASRDWVMRRRLSLLQAQGASANVAQLVRQTQRRAFDALAAQAAERSPQHDKALAQYAALRAELADELGAGWRVPVDELTLLESRRAQREQSLRELLDQSARDVTSTRPLPTPAAGDVHLSFHPLVSGWVVAAVTAESTTTAAPQCAVDAATSDTLMQCLIDAVADVIVPAQRLLVTPSGALLNVDVHALALGEATVLDRLPVLYSQDLESSEPAMLGAGNALVVGDATRQLPASRQEAQAVVDTLTQSGRFGINTLNGANASFAAVRKGLNVADLFHFAGHATLESGRTWTSALALANEDALSISDVLSLERAPQHVVLSACDTARVAVGSAGDSLGLAQAFVLRGSRAVVATARPVRDEDAQAFSRAFYRHWRAGERADVALRRAQLALRQTGTAKDWAAFRLLVR